MVRKKKNIDFGFTPSEYQQKIFDFVQHGVGNAVIRARAGSGKTSTAVASMKLIPKTKKCLFIAFNKSIVEELTEKLKSYPNCIAKTVHSLGYLMIRRNLGNDIEIDEYKYRTYIKSHITELTTIEDSVKFTRQELTGYIDSITMLVDYARFNLAQTVEEIERVADNYDIPFSYDECAVALKCLQWGKTETSTIDYTDMVWLPYELSLKPMGLQYDWIYYDECQDASLMSIELFRRCFKRGTRFMAFGDDFQCINQFAGSSPEAFDYMCEQPNTKVFDLPVSYRCARSITLLANSIVPDMKYRDDAPDGFVIDNVRVKDLREGDMVLARTKAPLVKLYVNLLRKNVNCYIKGNDIGQNLIKILRDIDNEELGADLKSDGVFVRLYDRMFTDRNKLMVRKHLDMTDATLSSSVMYWYDTINALSILAEGCKSKSELIDRIGRIFHEEQKGICLSTVHKSKGLEADNVYILCHSTMPSKLAKHEWEKTQERNLLYVAYTRAKNKLGFVSEKEISPTGSMLDPNVILIELKYIENLVCKILGKMPMVPMNNVEIAKFNLRSATTVEDIHENDNCVKVTSRKEEEADDNLIDALIHEYYKERHIRENEDIEDED